MDSHRDHLQQNNDINSFNKADFDLTANEVRNTRPRLSDNKYEISKKTSENLSPQMETGQKGQNSQTKWAYSNQLGRIAIDDAACTEKKKIDPQQIISKSLKSYDQNITGKRALDFADSSKGGQMQLNEISQLSEEIISIIEQKEEQR